MVELIYKGMIYGPQTFSVADESDIVEFKGKHLDSFGHKASGVAS